MHTLRKFFFRSPGHYIVALILTAAVGAFRFFTLPEEVGTWFALYETFSVSGFVTFLIGALLTVAYFGAFDLFGYVFSPGRVGEQRKYKNYTEYSHKKAEKRARDGYYFVPYFVVGAIVVLISFLFA